MGSLEAAIFDLDGVLTQTASLHARAWKQMFDAFLLQEAERGGVTYVPFDLGEDYRLYVDGKPRKEGILSFLQSRGIVLSSGTLSDTWHDRTVEGLGQEKNRIFNALIDMEGITVYSSSVQLLKWLQAQGVRLALATSSKNAQRIIKAAGLSTYFSVCVDGNDIARLGLLGKPEPDMFLLASQWLGSTPQHTMVLEDSVSGVKAAKAGGFFPVVGVDRHQEQLLLLRNGADIVVSDLSELLDAVLKSETTL